MNTLKRTRKAGFSLIELMIVVVIIGALTAIILPQFNASESEAKDVGCDASNYGTLRQLVNYKSINGVYPSRLHTAYEANVATPATMGTTDGVAALADVTAINIASNCTPTVLSTNQAASLAQAGIVKLSYGGFGMAAAFEDTAAGIRVPAVSADWLEDHSDGTSIVTINGVALPDYVNADPYDTATADNGIVVPLFVAPTADWENYYLGSTTASHESKVSVAQAGGCPWLKGGEQFRYYIAFFKVFNDGSAAKMIGTACPECGSLNP